MKLWHNFWIGGHAISIGRIMADSKRPRVYRGASGICIRLVGRWGVISIRRPFR